MLQLENFVKLERSINKRRCHKQSSTALIIFKFWASVHMYHCNLQMPLGFVVHLSDNLLNTPSKLLLLRRFKPTKEVFIMRILLLILSRVYKIISLNSTRQTCTLHRFPTFDVISLVRFFPSLYIYFIIISSPVQLHRNSPVLQDSVFSSFHLIDPVL